MQARMDKLELKLMSKRGKIQLLKMQLSHAESLALPYDVPKTKFVKPREPEQPRVPPLKLQTLNNPNTARTSSSESN
jgi:hypothetical protein